MTERADSQGPLVHLLSLDRLKPTKINQLLDDAQQFVGPVRAGLSDALNGLTVANLFFEPSTRTRASFELAARRLGADVINLDMSRSSTTKGESVLDTIDTLRAMAVDVFVIRTSELGIPALIAGHVGNEASVLNAGEAHVAHPTQGLLDALTIRQHKQSFDGLRVAIIGDIRHSRVARSAWRALRALGVSDLRLAAPTPMMPDSGEFDGATRCASLEEAVENADVVMALRIQKERISNDNIPDDAPFIAEWRLNQERLSLAKPDAIVMHPGPMNRDIEITSAVADGPQSVIFEQVANGVAVRMAVLVEIAKGLAWDTA